MLRSFVLTFCTWFVYTESTWKIIYMKFPLAQDLHLAVWKFETFHLCHLTLIHHVYQAGWLKKENSKVKFRISQSFLNIRAYWGKKLANQAFKIFSLTAVRNSMQFNSKCVPTSVRILSRKSVKNFRNDFLSYFVENAIVILIQR